MTGKIESLRLRAIALRSTVHNEHMLNAQELCGMVSKKTNEIIDVINELCKDIEGMKAQINYDEQTESLNLEV